jgi:hypothetical protein
MFAFNFNIRRHILHAAASLLFADATVAQT